MTEDVVRGHGLRITPLDGDGVPLTDQSTLLTDARAEVRTTTRWYIAVCQNCHGEDPKNWIPQPFRSPVERWKWTVAHTEGTGHDRWVMTDHH